MSDNKMRDKAREALLDRGKGGRGYYHSLVDFISAVSGVDRRTIDVNIIRLANVDLSKLRERGL